MGPIRIYFNLICKCTCFVALPLFAGFLIYALWRGVAFVDPEHRYVPVLNKEHVPEYLIYNLPDFLYALALFNALGIIWRNQLCPQGCLWLTTAFFTLICTELLQKWHCIPGTFDLWDIAAYILAAGAAALIRNLLTRINPTP